MSPLKNLVHNASRHSINAAGNSSPVLNFLLTFTRIIVITILIVYLITIIVNNCCRKGHSRKSLTPAQAQRLLLRKRGITPGPRQVNPYSCIESFFPTGDPVKDMLTLKNTMYNA